MTPDPFDQLQHPTTVDDLLTVVPYHVGFPPQQQLLVVLFTATGGLSMIMSTDVTQPHSPPAARWRKIAPALSTEGIRSASILLYGSTTHIPHALETARTSPVPIRHVLRIDDHRYWPLPSHRSPAPRQEIVPAGLPRTWTTSPAMATDCILAGLSYLGSVQDHLDRLIPGTDPNLHQVTALLHPLTAADRKELQTCCPAAGFMTLETEHHTRRDQPQPLEQHTAARILTALDNPEVRTACSDWNTVAAQWLWNDLLPLTPPTYAAPVLGLTALNAYLLHDTHLAHLASTLALDLDPTQPEARLTAQAIHTFSSPRVLTAQTHRAANQARLHLARTHHQHTR